MEGCQVVRAAFRTSLDSLGVALDGQLIATALEVLVAFVLPSDRQLQRVRGLLKRAFKM